MKYILLLFSVLFFSCQKEICDNKKSDCFIKMIEINNKVNHPEFDSGNLNFSEDEDKMVLVFEDFKIIELKKFYRNGVLKTEAPLLCSNYHGVKKTYHRDGTKHTETNYVYGVKGDVSIFPDHKGIVNNDVSIEVDNRMQELKDDLLTKKLAYDSLYFLGKNMFDSLLPVIDDLIIVLDSNDDKLIKAKSTLLKKKVESIKTMLNFLNKTHKYDDILEPINVLSNEQALKEIVSDNNNFEILYLYKLSLLEFFIERFN